MPMKFIREDARTCFRCDKNPPSFRLISLEKTPTEEGDLESDCGVSLICQSCLRPEMDDLWNAFAQSAVPVTGDESPTRCLCRQVGFAIVPLTISQRESGLLIDELGAECIEMAVDSQSP
jgi:hypothetical protein